MPAELSPELQSALERLVAAPAIPVEELKTAVRGHMAKAEQEAEDRVFFDASLARRLGQACLALLDLPGLDEPSRKLAQAAAVYYVEDEDEDGDFSSIIGFEDDAAVFNFVAAQIGHAELNVDFGQG